MSDRLIQRLDRAFELYHDLIDGLPADALGQKLPDLPSSPIGNQLWCVVGTRESFGKAIEHGEWKGWDCSLDGYARDAVASKLAASGERVLEVLGAVDLDDTRSDYALDLLEHETQHQGQLIRYLYGLRLDIPQSWKDRWALD
ncbi:MAG: hypothetical protein QF664_03690 [Dehalococcoidia bacterium]|jgi:hypothetical protein|nr:hypothetical protein [Dehalococcoidia bacterium]